MHRAVKIDGYHMYTHGKTPSRFLLIVLLHAVRSAIGMILLSVCPSVCLWRCVLWCSGSVQGIDSCIVMFLGGHFLFTSSDTFAVGCIIHPQHTVKHWTAEISQSVIAMGIVVMWPRCLTDPSFWSCSTLGLSPQLNVLAVGMTFLCIGGVLNNNKCN